MKQFRICVNISGYAFVEAESEEQALQKAAGLSESDFDWERFKDAAQDPEIVEEINYERDMDTIEN